MSEDPKLFDAGDYNLYRYCHNDPEDLTDPMGLWPVPPAGDAPPPPKPPPIGFAGIINDVYRFADSTVLTDDVCLLAAEL